MRMLWLACFLVVAVGVCSGVDSSERAAMLEQYRTKTTAASAVPEESASKESGVAAEALGTEEAERTLVEELLIVQVSLLGFLTGLFMWRMAILAFSRRNIL